MIKLPSFSHCRSIINQLLLIFSLLSSDLVFAQKVYLASESFEGGVRGQEGLRIAFYNVENLFDYFNDSTTIDEQFLPSGDHFWTKSRYQKKQNNLAKTIIAMGGWEPPALIGFCEVENRYVLEGLTKFTQLKSVGYEIIHQDSNDPRGIDVAAIYRPDKFKLLNYEYYRLKFPFAPKSRTRDILHAIGELPNKDTLHFFVNHWPSKFGGEFETKPSRMFAAEFVKRKTDSLLAINPNALIVITGDFNDEPDEESMLEGLSVTTDKTLLKNSDLFNLMYTIRFVTGTHSFENRWGILDQFVVSGGLMNPQSKSFIKGFTAQIFDMDFLIMEGATGARRPFRTYQGPKYIGGFSDHLPIIMDLVLRKE
uniref:endonuclease/exonuclease/phosphatase family protein n=1 Tax=Roseivirga sp. TaxID=1964215 RepID=UPI004048CAF0